MKSTRKATMAAVAVTSLLVLCAVAVSSAAAKPGSAGAAKVTISVASLIPGSKDAAVQQFNNQVAQFEKANPNIIVKPVEYQWTGPTFAAKLAAGTLPTVFEVPFTDARTLGDNGQLADLTAGVKALPYYSQYNRKLFAAAGLDPNKPPTTWAQVVNYALKISQKTGKAGYVQMAKDDNTA